MKSNSLWIRTAFIILVTLGGIYLVFGPRHAPTAADFTWQGIKNNLANNINLGLDLRGGSHLVMRVKTDEYLATLTENTAQAALQAAQEARDEGGAPLGVAGNSFIAQNGNYSITLNLNEGANAQKVSEEVRKRVDLTNWAETTGSNSITWSLPSNIQTTMKNQAVEQAIKIIDSRINALGVKEPTLQRHGAESSGQILLQMPGEDDPERIKKIIAAEAQLNLMKVVSPPSPAAVATYPTEEAAKQSLGGTVPPNRRVFPYRERDNSADANSPNSAAVKYVVVETPPIIPGNELRGADAVSRTGNEGDYQIAFSLKPGGAAKFGEWTSANINNYMAVVLNDEVRSVAFIQSRIDDRGEISGQFTKATADDLALTLRSGALPAKIEYQEERTVGPSLGADSIRAGVTASLAGIIFILIFMMIYYRGSGINAVVALILNMLLTVAAMVMMGSTLTLPGIAGLILGLGMSIDANVLIFERMREELRAGQSVAKALEIGFDRAFVTIVDTNVTVIISSVILYLYGSGPIRGFAVTLILGLIINLFTAVFVSRTIFMWLLQRNPQTQKISI